MQENRSFDHYFGTFPGADGIPMDDAGVPLACLPQRDGGQCVRPFHDPNDVNGGGPHGEAAAIADIDGGAMDGFLVSAQTARSSCTDPDNPACLNGKRLEPAAGTTSGGSPTTGRTPQGLGSKATCSSPNPRGARLGNTNSCSR